jgi:hypothetical protein
MTWNIVIFLINLNKYIRIPKLFNILCLKTKLLIQKQPNIYKKPKEEVKEQARIRKERQRQKQRKKYGDAEYKKMRAEEIAESRRKRKENDNSSNNL